MTSGAAGRGGWRTPTVMVGLAVFASACGVADPPIVVVAQRSDQISVPADDPAVTDPATADPAPEPADPAPEPDRQTTVEDPLPLPSTPDVGPDQPLDDAEIAVILADLEAAGFCDPADVENDGIVTAMHFVVQGEIQSPCYVDTPGDDVAEVVVDDDPRLLDAWASLTAITPVELVDDISLVAGYEPCSDCDTLAFVVALDTDATFFLLAVDVVSGAADPQELRLTMMHELTHVFAQAPGEQLVLQTSGTGCETYFNGVGCFSENSYIWQWIQEFWPQSELDRLPADGSVDDDRDAEERCRDDAAYTGSYAAVHPEEDFAETFSAYVYDVAVDPALSEKLAFFDQFPEFVAIRENARALGLAGTEANFEGCG